MKRFLRLNQVSGQFKPEFPCFLALILTKERRKFRFILRTGSGANPGEVDWVALFPCSKAREKRLGDVVGLPPHFRTAYQKIYI